MSTHAGRLDRLDLDARPELEARDEALVARFEQMRTASLPTQGTLVLAALAGGGVLGVLLGVLGTLTGRPDTSLLAVLVGGSVAFGSALLVPALDAVLREPHRQDAELLRAELARRRAADRRSRRALRGGGL